MTAATKALTGISLAVAIIVLLVVGTVGYSLYSDYNGIVGNLHQGGQGIQAGQTTVGSAERVTLNVTIPNKGMYTLSVAVACDPGQKFEIVCDPGSVSIAPGQQQVLRFAMTIGQFAQYQDSSDRRINGTLTVGLAPFLSFTVHVDLASLAGQGGA